MLKKIRENDRLHLFIDSESFEKSFSDLKKRLLTYNKIEYFEYLRSDFLAERPEILSVKQSEINLTAEYVQQLDTISMHALKANRSLTDGEKKFLLLILFYRFYYRQAYPTNFLFVTDNNLFIKHYQSLESFFPSIRLVKTETALSLMDLFAKSNGLYFVTPQWRETKKLWYWSYFRSKLPYYKVPTPLPASLSFTSNQILESFALRFTCLLTSIDEIGIQNYFGKDKDLMIPYHFNYFISLTT